MSRSAGRDGRRRCSGPVDYATGLLRNRGRREPVSTGWAIGVRVGRCGRTAGCADTRGRAPVRPTGPQARFSSHTSATSRRFAPPWPGRRSGPGVDLGETAVLDQPPHRTSGSAFTTTTSGTSASVIPPAAGCPRRSRRPPAAAIRSDADAPPADARCRSASTLLLVAERDRGQRGRSGRRRRRICPPNASTSLASPSVPGSTTSREITSPSTTMPPLENVARPSTYRRRYPRQTDTKHHSLLRNETAQGPGTSCAVSIRLVMSRRCPPASPEAPQAGRHWPADRQPTPQDALDDELDDDRW